MPNTSEKLDKLIKSTCNLINTNCILIEPKQNKNLSIEIKKIVDKILRVTSNPSKIKQIEPLVEFYKGSNHKKGNTLLEHIGQNINHYTDFKEESSYLLTRKDDYYKKLKKLNEQKSLDLVKKYLQLQVSQPLIIIYDKLDVISFFELQSILYFIKYKLDIWIEQYKRDKK